MTWSHGLSLPDHHHSCRSWSVYPTLASEHSRGSPPLNFHPWCSCCLSLSFGAPIIFLFSQSSSLTWPTLPHIGEPTFCLDSSRRSTCPLPGPFFLSGQQLFSRYISVLAWQTCPFQVGPSGIPWKDCWEGPNKALCNEKRVQCGLTENWVWGEFLDVSFCPLHTTAVSKQGRTCWWQQA